MQILGLQEFLSGPFLKMQISWREILSKEENLNLFQLFLSKSVSFAS